MPLNGAQHCQRSAGSLRVALALPLLLLALSGSATAQTPRIEGLFRVDPALVSDIVANASGPNARTSVADAIRDLYALGYFSWVRVETDADGSWVWRFQERPFVLEVERRGIHELSDEKVVEAIAIKANAFLDPRDVRSTRDALIALYRENGFVDTDVSVRTEPAGPNGEVRVIIEADEITKVRIVEVRVMGNRDLTDVDLLARLQSQPPGAFSFLTSSGNYDRTVAEQDAMRLEAAYLEQGYLKIRVDGPNVTYLPGTPNVIVEYSVREGLQYNLGKLDFSGDLFFRRDTLEKFIGLESGKPLNRLRLDEGVQAIVEAYSDFGFAFARVVPNFTFDDANRIANVTLNIVRGPLVYVRQINISGNTKTRDKVIRRELLIEEGELFSGRSVRLSRERVFALGFFEAVTFETEAIDEDQLDLNIRVTERPTGTASAGLGYSSIDKFVGNLRLNFGNLAGYGLRLDLQLEFGGRRQSFSVGFDDPYFLDTPFSLGVNVFRNRQRFFNSSGNTQEFTQDNLGGSLSVGYKLATYTRFFVAFRDELIRFSDISIQSKRFFTGGETRSLSLTLRRDTLNHPFDPSRGNRFFVTAEFAGGFLGGDHTFNRYRFVDQQFYTFLKFFTLSLRGELGFATSKGERVPFAERFFVGGIFTLRGYNFRSVGPSILVPIDPSDPYSNVSEVFVGGNKQVLLASELLFPLIPPAGIKGLFFFDAGNTWLEEQRLFATPLRMGWGFGFRWFSPIGPLRFEWGFPIDRRPDERKRVFEFSIGSFF